MPIKENIEQMFDKIAPTYDKLNHILSLNIDKSWRRRAVREIVGGGRRNNLDPDAPADVPQNGTSPLRILDVACGTCDITIEAAEQMKKTGVVGKLVGLDLSENMLASGKEKISKAGYSDIIEFKQGDCESLPFAEGDFDRVCAAFGVRNFEHIEVGLSEMHRVLAAGGKVVILELSVPQNKFFGGLYRVYFEHIMPWLGEIVSGDKPAYKYLPASVLNFPTPEKFCEMLREAGFTDVSRKSFSGGICQMYVGYKK